MAEDDWGRHFGFAGGNVFPGGPGSFAFSFGLRRMFGTSSAISESGMNVTESEWFTCTDHIDMIRFLGDRVSGKRLRLFAVGCCQRQRKLFIDQKPCYWHAVEVAEQYAKGLATLDQLADAYDVCDNDAHYERDPLAFYVQLTALHVTWKSVLGPAETPQQPDVFTAENVPVSIRSALYQCETRKGTHDSARQLCVVEGFAQVELLRAMIRNPFRPV